MKKNLLFCALAMMSQLPVSAQVTINSSDFAQAGDTLRVSMLNVLSNFNPADTGQNYTWDFSSLTPTSQQIDNFYSVAATPAAYQFSFNNPFDPVYKATVATPATSINVPSGIGVQITNMINYYRNDSDYNLVGFGATVNGLPMSVKYDTIDVNYRFPVAYGNVDSSYSKYHINIPSMGYFGAKILRINHVDAWGTITTPYGTFQAIRVKTELFETDTIYASSYGFGTNLNQPEKIEYKWWANNIGIPVLQVNTRITGGTEAVTQVIYRDSVRMNISGINNLSQPAVASVNVYPNPATSGFFVSYHLIKSANVSMQIRDVCGRLLYSTTHKEDPGTYKKAFNTESLKLTSGIYFLRFNAGNSVINKKIVVR